MPLAIETISFITALQTALMSLMLWAGTYGDAGSARIQFAHARRGVGDRSAGLGRFGGAHAFLRRPLLLLGGNALNLLAQGMSVVALRKLLGESSRTRLVILVGDHRVARRGMVRAGSAELRRAGVVGLAGHRGKHPAQRRSPARCVLSSSVACALRAAVGVFAMAAALLLIWRNVQLWLLSSPLQNIAVPGATNFFYVMLTGLQPLFAGIGFLLLYNEILQQELRLLARMDPLTGISNRPGDYGGHYADARPKPPGRADRWAC